MTGMPPPTGLLNAKLSGLSASMKVPGAPVSQLVVVPAGRSMIVPSEVASRPPSEEKTRADAVVSTPDAGGPAKLRASVPSAAFQSVTSPISAESAASVVPSGENATASICPSGDPICVISLQGLVAKSRTVPAPVRAAKRSPVGESVTCHPLSGPSVWQRT